MKDTSKLFIAVLKAIWLCKGNRKMLVASSLMVAGGITWYFYDKSGGSIWQVYMAASIGLFFGPVFAARKIIETAKRIEKEQTQNNAIDSDEE